MRWGDFLLRMRALLGLPAERELDEELSFHLEMEARKNRADGVPDGRAHQIAKAQFGGVEQVREECREVRGILLLENMARDIRYALRVLERLPFSQHRGAFTSGRNRAQHGCLQPDGYDCAPHAPGAKSGTTGSGSLGRSRRPGLELHLGHWRRRRPRFMDPQRFLLARLFGYARAQPYTPQRHGILTWAN